MAHYRFVVDSVFLYLRSLMPLLKGTYLGLSTIVVNQIVKLKRYVQHTKADNQLKIDILVISVCSFYFEQSLNYA